MSYLRRVSHRLLFSRMDVMAFVYNPERYGFGNETSSNFSTSCCQNGVLKAPKE